MVQRRTRKVLLLEKDPEGNLELQQQQEQQEQQVQLLAQLHLAPAEKFRYPETIPEPDSAEEDEDGPGVEGGHADIFSLNYDQMELEALYELMGKITPSTVATLRQRRDVLRASVADETNVAVEYYLDTLPSDGGSPTSSTQINDEQKNGYTYMDMVRRIFSDLDRNNESSARAGRNKIPTPKLESVGKKKTCIVNFQRICEAIHRNVEEVKEFVEKELSCKGNLDSKNALTLKYQMQKSTDLDNLLQRYLDIYVKCNSCNRIDTVLTRNGRLVELRCNFCTATRTVTAVINATYNAVVEKRARTRAAMTL